MSLTAIRLSFTVYTSLIACINFCHIAKKKKNRTSPKDESFHQMTVIHNIIIFKVSQPETNFKANTDW
jgi:hypothetical protein